MKSHILLVFLFSIGLALVCQRPIAQFGRDYNTERMKIGLPIIPDNWELIDVQSSGTIWRNPEASEKVKQRIPVHTRKTISYNGGILDREVDTYIGKDDYQVLEGNPRESLVIKYNYQRSLWSATLNQGDEYKILSLEEAEVILDEWGIERLSYEFPKEPK